VELLTSLYILILVAFVLSALCFAWFWYSFRWFKLDAQQRLSSQESEEQNNEYVRRYEQRESRAEVLLSRQEALISAITAGTPLVIATSSPCIQWSFELPRLLQPPLAVGHGRD